MIRHQAVRPAAPGGSSSCCILLLCGYRYGRSEFPRIAWRRACRDLPTRRAQAGILRQTVPGASPAGVRGARIIQLAITRKDFRPVMNNLRHPRWIHQYNPPRPALAYPVPQTEPVSILPVLSWNNCKRTILKTSLIGAKCAAE
jgi:hypothetical protein